MSRRVRIIMIFLLLGAVVNVAVAWGFWFWGERPGVSIDAVEDWRFDPSTKSDIREWRRLMNESWPDPPKQTGAQAFVGVRYREMIAVVSPLYDMSLEEQERLDDDERMELLDEGMIYTLDIVRCGAPLPAFRVATAIQRSGLSRSHFHRRDALQLGRLSIPRRIETTGFLVNTIFFAVILWLSVHVPRTLRRAQRRRRGLCEKCAYPVGASPVCSECGAAVHRPEAARDGVTGEV